MSEVTSALITGFFLGILFCTTFIRLHLKGKQIIDKELEE
jgi:hypothetical protein